MPNYYIDIGIRNVGAIAADQVTGWIYLDKEILEPVDYFAEEDVEYAGEQHGKVKVRLTVQRPEGQLFASYHDPYVFRIPILVHRAEDTSVEYMFTSTQGKPASAKFNLRLSSLKTTSSDET